MSNTDFKITGHPEAGRTANLSGAGSIIASPGSLRFIAIHDVLASEATTLRIDSVTGSIIAYIPAGASNLSSSVTGGKDKAIYNTAGNVTITYSELNI
tara:strand:- start:6635 stop:6928 length:294 start_codon:yes stop_codon:yes gene_type:complete